MTADLRQEKQERTLGGWRQQGSQKERKKAIKKQRRGRHQQENFSNIGLSPQRCRPLLLRQGYKVYCGGVRHNGVLRSMDRRI